MNAGARPVFCDVDPDTLCITAETVRPHLSERTRRDRGRPPVRERGAGAGAARARRAGARGRRPGRRRHARRRARRARSATPPPSASSRRRTCPAWATAGRSPRDSDEVAERARAAALPRLDTTSGPTPRWATTRGSTRSRRPCCGCCCPSSTAGTPRRREAAAAYERAGLGELVRLPRARPRAPSTSTTSTWCAPTTPDELAARAGERGRPGARLLPHADAPPAGRWQRFARRGAARHRRARGARTWRSRWAPSSTAEQVDAVVERLPRRVPA